MSSKVTGDSWTSAFRLDDGDGRGAIGGDDSVEAIGHIDREPVFSRDRPVGLPAERAIGLLKYARLHHGSWAASRLRLIGVDPARAAKHDGLPAKSLRGFWVLLAPFGPGGIPELVPDPLRGVRGGSEGTFLGSLGAPLAEFDVVDLPISSTPPRDVLVLLAEEQAAAMLPSADVPTTDVGQAAVDLCATAWVVTGGWHAVSDVSLVIRVVANGPAHRGSFLARQRMDMRFKRHEGGIRTHGG